MNSPSCKLALLACLLSVAIIATGECSQEPEYVFVKRNAEAGNAEDLASKRADMDGRVMRLSRSLSDGYERLSRGGRQLLSRSELDNRKPISRSQSLRSRLESLVQKGEALRGNARVQESKETVKMLARSKTMRDKLGQVVRKGVSNKKLYLTLLKAAI